jgi:lysozyme family protein
VTEAARRCIEFVLRNEGGLANNPNDPGGLTNYGIAKRSHPNVDVAQLTRSEAALIYRAEYWDPIEGDALPEPVALALLDFAVNSGVSRAVRTLNALCFVAAHEGLSVVAVQARAKALGACVLAEQLVRERALFLAQLGCDRRGSEEFLPGWFRRIRDNLRAVRAMEAEAAPAAVEGG